MHSYHGIKGVEPIMLLYVMRRRRGYPRMAMFAEHLYTNIKPPEP